MTYSEYKVGLNTGLAGILSLVLTKAGAPIPEAVLLAAIGLTAIVSAYFSPGWADKAGLQKYPAGGTAAVVVILGWVGPYVPILKEFTSAEIVTLAGLIPMVVGLLTPAAEEATEDPELDRERVGL